MASEAVDRRGELRRRIQQLQSALSSMEDPQQQADEQAPQEVTLQSLSTQLAKAEHRMLGRFQSSERYLLQQFDEQSLASIMITGLMIATGLYIMYFLFENLLRIRRCRCPDISANDLDIVLTASKLQIIDFNKKQESLKQAETASAVVHTPVVKTVVAESCSA